MEYTIRPYNSADKPILIELLKLNTPKYFDTNEEKDFDVYLDTCIEDYYVMATDKEIVRCGGINYHNHNSAFISWDIFHPDYQGKGLGMQLLDFRINQIKTAGVFSRVVVRTSQFTFKFYEKAGFRLEEISKDYWAKGIDLYYMVLDL